MKVNVNKLTTCLKQTKHISNQFLKLQNSKNTREQNLVISFIINNLLEVEKKIIEIRDSILGSENAS